MSDDKLPKPKKNADFWRACRHLYPHRGIVMISILCAVFVGAAFTSGLSTMLPMLRVLINGDTVPAWVNRQIVESRTGAKLFESPARVQIAVVKPNTPAAAAGLADGDILTAAEPAQGSADESSPTEHPALSAEHSAAHLLATLSSPQSTTLTLRRAAGAPAVITLKPVPWYFVQARQVAQRLPTHPVAAIGVIFAVIAILAVIGNCFRFFQEYLSDKAAILTVNDIRRKLYDHILHIPLGYFGQKGSSDVTSRLVQDSQGLENGFKTVLGQSIQEPIRAAMAFGLALLASWRLTLFIVIFAPIMVAIIRKFGKKMRRANRKALQRSSSMLGQIEGTLMGIRVVKSANAERHERRRYTRIMDQLVAEQLRMSRIDAWSTPTMETLTLLVVGAVLLFASYLVLIAHTLTVERFFLVMACLMGIGESLRRLGKVNNVLSKASAAAARIFETLDIPAERPRELQRAKAGSRQKAEGSEGNGLQTTDNGPLSTEHSALSTSSLPTPPRPHYKLPPLSRDIRFEHLTFT
jgi:ABC-type multidrug transport system fused ATPase/permease subunit